MDTTTFVVLNNHRAVLYAGSDRSAVDTLLRPVPLNPGDRLGDYAEAWRDGECVGAWNRKERGWLSPDGKGNPVTV